MYTAIQLHFQNIQQIIRQGKAGALQAATAHFLSTYWYVGYYLSHRLTENTYGKNIVTRLADWLKQQESACFLHPLSDFVPSEQHLAVSKKPSAGLPAHNPVQFLTFALNKQ
jgi:DUF1016 N-terminal domain